MVEGGNSVIVVIGILAYLAIAAAQTAVLEKIFEGEYDEYFNWPLWVSLVWPLTAPFLFVKYAVAKLLEQVGDEK